MSYPKQKVKCSACKGSGRVARISKGPKLFERIIGKPLPMTFLEAQERLRHYKGSDAGALTLFVRQLADNLETVLCPWCNATGIAYTLQQLTPEEAASVRVKETVESE